MNIVNRVVIVILLLVAIVLCSVSLVGARRVLPAVAQQSAALADSVEELEWYRLELPGVVIALIVDLVLVLLIFLELRRPSRKAIRVEKTAGGEVQISVASIADRLRYEVDQLPGVLRTAPKVSGKRGGVVVEMETEVAAGINVPEESGRILETTRRVVEEDMGLKLARPPKVRLRVLRHPKMPPHVSRRETPPAAPEEKPPVVADDTGDAGETLWDKE